jgi:putative membrane-bound dehydrogenase-like protein
MRHAQIMPFLAAVVAALGLCGSSRAADANRLAYLDSLDPYYVSRNFPKLTTPQWVGEEGVDAVVILSIDDMRDPARYEPVIRPALDRLKQIDGKAHFSIMTCKIDPSDPRIQKWLAEGVSLECHTIDHPCPILANDDLARARKTFDDCIDLMDAIPGSRSVAFRTPCCDSKNTFSPRLISELFDATTQKGNFLQIDSSVFHRFTADDPALPRDLVLNDAGADRYQRYVPFPSYADDIRDYPYPYVIGRLCWEFPCVTPTDWQSFNIQQAANPQLLKDWEAQLDATVIKKGTFTLCFHPYGWSSPQQIAALVDYADKTYGKRIRFLNFREVLERLNKNLLGGQSLRAAAGGDNGVRLLDLNNDGYLDVVISNDKVRQTRVWDAATSKWLTSDFPAKVAGGQFGIVRSDGAATVLVADATMRNAWTFSNENWIADAQLGVLLQSDPAILTQRDGIDQGVRLRDIDGEGICQLIISNPSRQAIYRLGAYADAWAKLPFSLPQGATIVDARGRDAGLRFVDVEETGFPAVLFSDEKTSSLFLFDSPKDGWSRTVMSGPRVEGDQTQLPPIVRDGTNNGVWFLHRTMWAQNETTSTLPDVVDRRTFNTLLAKVDPIAKSPEASLHSIEVHAGFQVELVACEPMLQSPIAFAWGPDGRFWVVEMGDYPLGLDGKGKPGGRVKILESTHNDGHYDKMTIFLDGIPFPTGVMPWGRGAIITAAPNILYAEDSKRDGHCDVKKTLFTGFVEGNQQHRVNGLVYGLDNWAHGANGHSGGIVKSFKGGEAVNISGRDFRVRPDEGIIDTEVGMTQFGRCMDDWGNWFGNDNSNPGFQFVLEERYLRRNKFYATQSARVDVSDEPGAVAVYPASRTLPRFNDPWGADHFTSACSVSIYRDNLFGPALSSISLISEPVHDLVHAELIHRDGTLYHSSRLEDETTSEFWRSSDNWTRPTTVRTGPDGALWIADMYRYVIEHPQWIPKDWQARLDLRAGQDKGRIYRMYPVGAKLRAIPRLDGLDAAGLVAALDSPSGWQRDMAQQLLVRGKEKSAAPLLARMIRESKNPLARVHALCALDGIDALAADDVLAALKDSAAGVRRHAVRLCEGRFSQFPQLGPAMLNLLSDPDAQVRLQLACTLGEWDDPRAGETLGRLLLRDGDEKYIAAGAYSSINDKNLDVVIHTVMAGDNARPASQAVLVTLLKIGSGMGNSKATAALLSAVTRSEKGTYTVAQFNSLSALLDTLGASGDSLEKMAGANDPDLKSAVDQLSGVFQSARTLARDDSAKMEGRAAAVGILAQGNDHRDDDIKLLAEFLQPQSPEPLQHAAAATLGRLRSAESFRLLLSGWRGYSPAMRLQALDLLVGRGDAAAMVIEAVEKKQIAALDIDAPHRQRLLQSGDRALRARAAAVFARAINPNRQKVVDAYSAAMNLKGSSAHGGEIFAKTCSGCHQLAGVGHAVGPDLASVGDKSIEGLMIDILDPNRAVEPQYINYIAETRDGETISGVLRSETGNSVTLRIPQGIEQTVLRSNLKLLRSTGLSLMPEGLETGISPQDLADLIAFVQSAAPAMKPKSFEGNRPEVVMPSSDGALRLLPSNCEIFGSKLTLEKRYGNLGQWTADNDRAVWTVQPARAGTYLVYLEYACDPPSAGNILGLQCGAERLVWRIAGTNNRDTYHREFIGEMTLSARRQRLTARADGRISGSLLDLRSIEIFPVPPKLGP